MHKIDADKIIEEIQKGIQEKGNFETDAEHVIDFINVMIDKYEIREENV